MISKTNKHSHIDLTPWKPTPRQLPQNWMELAARLAEEAKGSPHSYVMDVRYNAEGVRDLLHSWGLPWQVVIAGYLWEYDKEQIRRANLNDIDQVLDLITDANLYARYIQDENLLPLLNPPYQNLDALLITVVIYYQALRTLQQQSNDQPYTGTKQLYIESVGNTLLNIATRLGLWNLKRDIEDLTEQLCQPTDFTDAKQQRAFLLEKEAEILGITGKMLMEAYYEATRQPVMVDYTPCGIAGMKRRLQDAHTTATSQKRQLTSFDLVTFEVVVPRVQDCYAAFGVLSQLGSIQDRVTDQIANPKPNGYSHISFGLILKPQARNIPCLQWPETFARICQLEITTHLMQAIANYGCLHPDCYELYTKKAHSKEIQLPPAEQLWKCEAGKVFYTIKENLTDNLAQLEAHAPIVVYDKDRRPVALPKGATALDFAFEVDSSIGEHAVDCIVNNRKTPLYRKLNAADIVEIRTSNEIQTQDHWLDETYTTTPKARRLIKESLNRRFLNRRGYDLLRQELEHHNYRLTPEALHEELRLLLGRHKLGTFLAYLEQLGEEAELQYTPKWAAQEIMNQIAERNNLLSIASARPNWIPVLNVPLTGRNKNITQQRLCSICQPTYPRDTNIKGRLRKRTGELVVHKESCPYLLEHNAGQKSVLLPMSWQPNVSRFRVGFFLRAQDRRGLIHDITRQLRRYQCDFLFMNADATNRSKDAHIRFTIETHTDQEALYIWQELRKIQSVTKVEIDPAATPKDVYDRLQKLHQQSETFSDNTVLELPWEGPLPTLQLRRPILNNPFDISRPATAKMFFGRSTETEIMRRELCDSEQGRSLILYGPRRSGKSSICKNFLDHQIIAPFWGVLYSLQNATQQNEEITLMQLAEKISSEFSEQFWQPVSGWHDYNDTDPQLRFRRLVQNCLAQIPDTRLVLVLDEFGGAFEAYEKNILKYRFFTYWKELMSEISQLSLTLILPTSSHNLLSSGVLSNAFSFAASLPVQFLDTESAEQLLVDPLKDQHIVIHPNTVALAVKLTGGNPYYMTLIGQRLIQQLNREQDKQLVTDENLHLIVDQLIEEGNRQNFDFLASELQSRDEFRILAAIVELTSHTKQPKVQLKKISAVLDLPIPLIRQHLDRLRIGLILEEHGPTSNPYYSFRIELVRRWLTRNRWFFQHLHNKEEHLYVGNGL